MPTTSDPRTLKLPRPLHGPSHPQGPSVGPDVDTVKRGTARAFPEIFPWPKGGFDLTYNHRLEHAWHTIELAHPHLFPNPAGQYGEPAHAFLTHLRRAGHPTEWAIDQIGINEMTTKWEAIHHPPTPPIDLVKAAMHDFMVRSLASAWRWHYSWQRPMSALGRRPEDTQYSDCSTGVSETIYWGRVVTGILVPDPNDRGWDGIGNTDTLWAANASRPVHDYYELGDLAFWTAHGGHVAICMEPGTYSSSVWWSNGRESAPNTMHLSDRTYDYRGALRPRLLP